jgi:plastocyanin
VAAVRGLAARRFFAGIGLLVLCVGAYSVWHGARVATGALHRQAPVDLSQAQIQYEAQTIRMEQRGNGYFPSELTVHRGRPVRWVIDSKSEFSCASSIVIPQLGITKDLKRGENVIEFTPTEDMDIGFSCSMGMYNGKIKVID